MNVRQDMLDSTVLSPSQARAFDFLCAHYQQAPLLHLQGDSQVGKTIVLRMLQQRTGAFWVDIQAIAQAVERRHPLAIEEGVLQVLSEAIAHHALVLVDDFDYCYRFANQCGEYIRTNYHETVLKVLVELAASRKATLVVATTDSLPHTLAQKSLTIVIEDFQVADYQFLIEHLTKRDCSNLQYDHLHRLAPHLDCRDLIRFCVWIDQQPEATTADILDYVRSQGLSSNVNTGEVQRVSLDELFGVDRLRESLEQNIILPLENLDLAAELGLTPKRGVILAGPPGTGKTTVGRALAHRLRGKFFLIDGTMISGTDRFYYEVDWTFRQAVQNAPSVVFIDDSDVIFESGREHGLYRYLLTKLDGLESISSSHVCVMLTAMDLGNIPPALMRSGRIELWLETQLPDDPARKGLLSALFGSKFRVSDEGCWTKLVDKTRGLSGADLKRVVQDAKLLLASDRVKQRPTLHFEDYLITAIDELSTAQRSYLAAVKRAYSVNADRPRWFNVHPELFDQ
jgi:AAA+ superfamily predicted ATPase